MRLLWSGAFENGASSWTAVHAKDGGFTIVPAPGREGKAGRFVVRPGDVPIGTSGERAEVYVGTGESAGTESFWAWSAFFPRGSSSTLDTPWNVFTQWHQTRTGGVQPLSFEIENVRGREWIRLRVWGGKADSPAKRAWRLAPLVRGKWYDFAFRVRWAPDQSGLVQVWLNREPVAFASRIPTLYYDESVYLKQGFYRQSSNLTSEVYIAETRRGASLEDIGISEQVAAVPTASAPRNTAAPVIRGVTKPGRALRATRGVWSNAPSRFGYQWQSSRDGSSWTNLVGADRPSLVLPPAFSARAVRIRITATNSAGSVVAVSAVAKTSLGANARKRPSADPNAVRQSIRAGQVLRGTVVWTAVPGSGVRMIVFAMDSNKVTHSDSKPPYAYVVDTTRLANGRHTLGLTVTRSDGTVVWKPYQIGAVTIDNP